MTKILTPKQRRAFIEGIAPWAQTSQAKWEVPASVIIAQAILESGWGQSQLASKYNNYFGIKDSSRENDGYCEFLTDEFVGGKKIHVRAKFEAFADAQRCFDAHGRMLASLPRYQPAMKDRDDPVVFAARLKECGYSTRPDYPSELVGLIRTYELTRFDGKKS